MLALAGLALSGVAQKSKPAVSMAQAKATVLALHPGTIKSGEMEKENGLLIYSFDVQTKTDLREVNVDSATGKVVEDSVENPADEAKEAAADQKAKH